MLSLPKVPSTLSEKCILPVVSNTSTKQKMKNVKTPVNNKSTIASTSLFEDLNVEERNKHSFNLSDNEVCEIPEKRKKILLSENSSKDSDGEEENECPSIMKQSDSTLLKKQLLRKSVNTLLLRQANNAQEYDKKLSFKVNNMDENANQTFNDVNHNIRKQNKAFYRKENSSTSSFSSSTDEKIIYLIELMQKILQKLSQLVVKIDLLDNRMLTIDGNNGQNTVNKQQKEDAELEGLEEIFPFQTQTNLYSFDQKLANKKLSRDVLIHYFTSIGGRDCKEMTTNILKNILTDSVVTEFSWDGRKKECFRNLHILKEIIRAVRRRWPNEDLITIKPIISRWLINAKLRLSRSTSKKFEKESFKCTDDEEKSTISSDESS